MIASLLCLLLTFAPSNRMQTGYPRTMYVGFQRAPVYESADYLAPIIGELRRGDSVKVLGSEGKYFRIQHDSAIGYVLGSNLLLVPQKKKQSKARASATPVRSSDTPSKGRDSASAVSSTQCSATTRAGVRCSRMVDDGSAVCWQHRKK